MHTYGLAVRLAALMGAVLPVLCYAQLTKYHPEDDLFAPPGNVPGQPAWMVEDLGARDPRLVSDETYEEWLHGLKEWRQERLIRIGYDDAQYKRPDLLWTQRDFIVPQMMVEDRYFYDPASGKYTVDRYLRDVEQRYGGIDGVLIWPVYPNAGIDNRSQFDLARDLPGGVEGVRKMVEEFHSHHVRVFFPMMPWDTGTHEEGISFPNAVARLMAQFNADGVNGDTFTGIPRTYRVASDKTGHPIAFQPEVNMDSDEFLMWDQQSWGYWRYPFAPLVSSLKVLEPRHMINVCDRWAHNRTDNLQAAFFNGVGYVSWENVWGIWNGVTPRDGEALRRISAIYRQFADFFTAADWRPAVPMLQFGVFASEFPLADRAIWTIVNRNGYDVDGGVIAVGHREGAHYFDLMSGAELNSSLREGKDTLSLHIEAKGYAAVLRVEGGPAPHLEVLNAKPLSAYSAQWQVLPQAAVEIKRTPPHATTPEGMIQIPAARYDFAVSGLEIEGGNDIGVDVQYAWENSPRRQHRHQVQIDSFYIDKYPVTNAQFAAFLKASHYQPADTHNFVKDLSASRPNQPVTWVSIEDARAYAAWAGKRLPHEWEWQYAAQGSDGRTYPWGGDPRRDAIPPPQTGHDLAGPPDVGAHPAGASPFGVMDLWGNVFEWTDEYVDEHTRAAVLRGDGYYHPQGSPWYFPHPAKLTEHAKYLLMAPAKDRSATVGFRCSADR